MRCRASRLPAGTWFTSRGPKRSVLTPRRGPRHVWPCANACPKTRRFTSTCHVFEHLDGKPPVQVVCNQKTPCFYGRCKFAPTVASPAATLGRCSIFRHVIHEPDCELAVRPPFRILHSRWLGVSPATPKVRESLLRNQSPRKTDHCTSGRELDRAPMTTLPSAPSGIQIHAPTIGL